MTVITPLPRLLMALCLTPLAALPLAAQTAPHAHGGMPMIHHMQGERAAQITVFGEGRSMAAPDRAMARLGVTTEAASAAEAMAQNNAKQAEVIEALKAAGIEARDLQTSGLRLDQRVAYPDGQAPQIQGYTASNLVTVRVRDLDQLGAVLDSAISAGATNLDGLEFTRADDGDQQDEARRAAVEDAMHRAQIIAEAAGMELGPLIEVSEEVGMGGPPQPTMMMARPQSADASVPVERGELSTTVTLRVIFAVLPKGE